MSDSTRPVTGFHARTDAEKLAKIAALCDTDGADVEGGDGFLMTSQVRAVLDAPSVSAARAGGIDRDALITLLGAFSGEAFGTGDIDYGAWGDRILALVQPAPPIQAAVTDTMGLNPLGNRLGEHGFDADDVEVILQDVATFFGIDDEAEPAPPAVDLAVVRRILTDALPADPKWAEWVEGRIDEIAKAVPSAGVVLTHRDAQTALGWYADAFRDGETPAGYDRDLAQKLGDAS